MIEKENMMSSVANAGDDTSLPFFYHSLRNISGPDDTRENRRVFVGYAPFTSFLDLGEDENVRGYLVTAEGKRRQRLFDVHRQMRDTLENRPDQFSVLNGGITIVATDADVDDKKKVVLLNQASIINGSQTRGELRHYAQQCSRSDIDPYPVYVKFEIVVTDDSALKAEVSISRNSQNAVNRLSIVGRRGQLDEFEQAIQSAFPDAQLSKSETQRPSDDNNYLDTEKVLQVCTALIPSSIWPKPKEQDDPKKVYTYSMKSKCLREFQGYQSAASDTDAANHDLAKEIYQFYLDIAPTALSLYQKWKTHPEFKGTGLRAIERDNGGNVVEVPEGIIFPIISSLSAFVERTDGGWTLNQPKVFDDKELIAAAKSQYINTAKSNPWNMGKSQAVYSSLLQITKLVKQLAPN